MSEVIKTKNEILKAEESQALDLKADSNRLPEENKNESSRVLILEVSAAGTKLQFQSENEINFINLDEPFVTPINFSFPVAQSRWPRRNTDVLLKSKSYDHILNDPVMNQAVEEYLALSPHEKKLFDLALDKKIRKLHRKKTSKVKEIDLNYAVQTKNYKHDTVQAYLEQVTKELELKGMWREESQEGLESDLFFLDDVRDHDLNENFEPKALDLIYNFKKMPYHKDSMSELTEQGLEWKSEMGLTPHDLPKFTESPSHNILRRSPWSLDEKMARLLVDGALFKDAPISDELFPCAYFVSKSIFARELFIQVKFEALARTPLQKRFRTYSFRKYEADQKRLKKVINEALKAFFIRNPEVVKSVEKYSFENALSDSKTKSLLKSIWARFFDINRKLTKKQRAALEAIYCEEPTLTYTEAAKIEGISRDSLQDRVKGAVKKFKDSLPELENIDQKKLDPESKPSNLLYNGFYNKQEAMIVRPLFRLNTTGERNEITAREGKPILKSKPPNSIRVRAWAIANTPIPDFIDTDFYLGLVPDGVITRRKGKTKFRG